MWKTTTPKLSHSPAIVRSISENTKVNTSWATETTYAPWRKLLLFPHISYFSFPSEPLHLSLKPHWRWATGQSDLVPRTLSKNQRLFRRMSVLILVRLSLIILNFKAFRIWTNQDKMGWLLQSSRGIRSEDSLPAPHYHCSPFPLQSPGRNSSLEPSVCLSFSF